MKIKEWMLALGASTMIAMQSWVLLSIVDLKRDVAVVSSRVEHLNNKP